MCACVVKTFYLVLPFILGNHQLEMFESNKTFITLSMVEIYGDQNLENLLLKLPTTTVTWREVFLVLFDALNEPLTTDAALFKVVLDTSVRNCTHWQVSFKKLTVTAQGFPYQVDDMFYVLQDLQHLP